MKRFLIIYFILFVPCLYSQSSVISGRVTGESNKPLYGANVVIEGTIDGSTTDSAGYYEFETEKSGTLDLIVTAVGFSEKKIPVTIQEASPLVVNIRLTKEEIKTDEILVTASSFTSGQQSQVTITPLEIVRIPGSDADIYRAITTFPGSNQVDEGSRITVRGGNENEVLTILDQASLYHPFIFDDEFNTSSYTTVNPWGLKGINFSSGGFSAKYGNALSAVLDLKSYDLPQGSGLFLWLGLANIGISGVYLSPDRKFGATFDAGQTILEPYFKINGYLTEDYSPIPLARGFGGTLAYKPDEKTSLKLYADYSQDKIGIRYQSPDYDGFFKSDSKTYFTNLKYSAGFGTSALLSAGISFSKHEDNINYGVLDTRLTEYYSKLRVDLTQQITGKIDLNYGGEYEYNETKFKGIVPLLSYYIDPSAPGINLDSRDKTSRAGTYAEAQLRFTKDLFAITGLRGDYHSLSRKFSFDPRLSLGYRFAKDNSLRAAAGLYHQYPSLEYYSQSGGLKPEQAVHYILGYEINKMDGLFLFRVEAYYKDYKNLVLRAPDGLYYSSEGKGFARGVDVFLKSRVTNKYSGWISYSFVDSKRSQYEVRADAPADYDITHNLTIVGSYYITDNIVTGLTYRVSTGRPFTPVNGSVFDSAYSVYRPLYGESNSGRFPAYHRLDMNFQYTFSFFGRFAIAVFQVNNVLNNKNLYDYTYNFDYSLRKEIITSNKRQMYVAFGLQL